METVPQKIKTLLSLMRLNNLVVEVDEAGRKINITADEDEWFTKQIPDLVKDIKHLTAIIARKSEDESYFVDINNYRKEREKLISELAKAAATKAVTTKAEVKLPPMNAYERRLVHMELSMRPDVKTESIGEGRDRGVVVRPL